MVDLDFHVDPEIGPDLATRLIRLWTDVTNADGAVGLVPPVTVDDVRPLADKAFGAVRTGESHLVVAETGGEPVGFFFLEHRPGPLFRHWAELKRLQIRPDLQGAGLGTELLQAAAQSARDLGLEQLRARVRGGTGAEAFYVKHGYEIVARVPDAIRVAPGDDREEIYLILRL
ncbi:MAG: GNAT family N-acetyltransferase [Actinobacteria bacterium]|nr:GNAT family N-acetyltransferase [Actinomycetota bacterium]